MPHPQPLGSHSQFQGVRRPSRFLPASHAHRRHQGFGFTRSLTFPSTNSQRIVLELFGGGWHPSPVLFKRAAKVAVILAVALSIGLHWALLQSVAWTGMFVTFAQQTTLRAAFTKTFDGKHPCRICKLVREGQQSEKSKESLLPLVKIESLPCATAFVLTPPTLLPSPTAPDTLASLRAESPPIPPPRAA